MFETHRISPKEKLAVTIDGIEHSARSGESVASVLMRSQVPWSQIHPVDGTVRNPYCMMGVCFECLVTINGVQAQRACMTEIQSGMTIQRRKAPKDITK